MIKVDNIRRTFGEQHVLKGINTVFETGKTNLIIGRSGAGKTVLLKILVGLIEPTEGAIWFDDRNFTAMTKKERTAIRTQVGMLFQGSALFDSMTVEENVRFPLDMFTKMTFKEKQELEKLPMQIEQYEAEQRSIHAKMAESEYFKKAQSQIVKDQRRLSDLDDLLVQSYAKLEDFLARNA